MITFFSFIALFLGLFHTMEISQFIFYICILFIQVFSFYLMKFKTFSNGVKLYIIAAIIGIFFYTTSQVIHFYVFLTLFLCFITLAVFVINEPYSLISTVILFIIMSYKIIFTSELLLRESIVELLFLGLTVFIMIESKLWLTKLNGYKLNSLKKTQNVTLKILGKISEIKDLETTNHLMRVEIMVEDLVIHLQKSKEYSNYITDKYQSDIKSAAYLHDIGRIGISDIILNKNGKLTDEEFDEIKKHTILGYNILKEAQNEIEEESIFHLALEITRHHHEKWDGSGYPDRLSGKNIPLSARIMSIIDVYDALISKRPYKEPLTHEEAINLIKDGSNSHFDPFITQIFISNSEDIYRKINSLL